MHDYSTTDILLCILYQLCSHFFLSGITLWGILCGKRTQALHALMILLTAGVWNDCLKQCFCSEYITNMGIRYHFPSGHTHAITLFYALWLRPFDRNRAFASKCLRIGLWLACVIGAGSGMIWEGVHFAHDILGGFLFGCLELPLIFRFEHHPRFPWMVFGIATLCFTLWCLIPTPVFTCAWLPFACLIGLFIGLHTAHGNWIARLSMVAGACFLTVLLQALNLDFAWGDYPVYQPPSTYIRWGIIGFLFTCIPNWQQLQGFCQNLCKSVKHDTRT